MGALNFNLTHLEVVSFSQRGRENEMVESMLKQNSQTMVAEPLK